MQAEVKLDAATFLTIYQMVREYEKTGLSADALSYYMHEIAPAIRKKHYRMMLREDYKKNGGVGNEKT